MTGPGPPGYVMLLSPCRKLEILRASRVLGHRTCTRYWRSPRRLRRCARRERRLAAAFRGDVPWPLGAVAALPAALGARALLLPLSRLRGAWSPRRANAVRRSCRTPPCGEQRPRLPPSLATDGMPAIAGVRKQEPLSYGDHGQPPQPRHVSLRGRVAPADSVRRPATTARGAQGPQEAARVALAIHGRGDAAREAGRGKRGS